MYFISTRDAMWVNVNTCYQVPVRLLSALLSSDLSDKGKATKFWYEPRNITLREREVFIENQWRCGSGYGWRGVEALMRKSVNSYIHKKLTREVFVRLWNHIITKETGKTQLDDCIKCVHQIQDCPIVKWLSWKCHIYILFMYIAALLNFKSWNYIHVYHYIHIYICVCV